MKAFLLLPLSVLLRTAACNQPAPPQDAARKDCNDVICTEVFAMVTAEVPGTAGAPFDEVYTLRVGTGEKIKPEQGGQPGTYVVLDDSYWQQLANRQDTFRFIAIRAGKQVINEPYVIGADCCHIHKVSGASVIGR